MRRNDQTSARHAAGRTTLVLVVVAIWILGCAPTVDVPSPSAVLATSVATRPPPTATQSSSPALSSEPSPKAATIGMTERERSDWFWSQVTHYGNYREFASLAEITKEAHLVIRGRVTGRVDGELELFSADVANVRWGVVTIDEVLKGSPIEKAPGSVLVEDLGAAAVSSDIPKGEVILFLWNYAQLRVDVGNPPSRDADDRYYYGRPNGYQGVLRDLDGVVRVPKPFNWNGDLGAFLGRIDGEPYDEVVDRIRSFGEDDA